MKIRFLFHKPIGERGVGKAIVAWTGFLALFYNWKLFKYPYSHVEIWMVGGFGVFEIEDMGYFGKCFSSTTRGTSDGVRIAPACDILHNPYRWDYIETNVDPERCEVALAESNKLIGLKYDYGYILSFLQPFILQKEKAWACSELCDWFRVLCGLIPPKKQKRVSPRRLAYILSKKWGNPVPLE